MISLTTVLIAILILVHLGAVGLGYRQGGPYFAGGGVFALVLLLIVLYRVGALG